MSLLAKRANQPSSRFERALAFVAESLDAMADRRSRLAVITVPAPVAPLEVLSAFDEPAILWDPPRGPSALGIGHAAVLTASSPDRIADIARQAEALWQRVERLAMSPTTPGPGVISPPPPRLYGGFAFAEGAASSEPWREFGDARFVLPNWLYTRDNGSAWLSLIADTDTLPDAAAGHLGRLERLLYRLESNQLTGAGTSATPSPRTTIKAIHTMEPAEWRRRVEHIRAAIADRRCEKIVAAQCTAVELARPAHPVAVLGELDRCYPSCYRFGFRFGPNAVFVGATPERLIQRDGNRIYTEALAGSIAAAPESMQAAARALLASSKDRSEQKVVVRAIEDVLSPLCSRLDVPAEPVIRELRHVLHLETPISGDLDAPTHVLDLVAALHPTPAVGGAPTAAAMAWIAEHESEPRGWYAAPVGWFDANGQGEFAVAIRSGLLVGQTAYLYVGAGIVQDSDPDAEMAETRLKQRAVLGALGITR